MSNSRLTAVKPSTIYRVIAAAKKCADQHDRFALDCLSAQVWGRGSGRVRSGAARVLRDIERMGLVRKLGRNRSDMLVYELSDKGRRLAESDPLEVVAPVASIAPVAPVAPVAAARER